MKKTERKEMWQMASALLFGLLSITPVQAQQLGPNHGQSDADAAALAQSFPAVEVFPETLRVPQQGQQILLGEWGPVIQWPHVPVSAANLPDGRILTWASNQRDSFPAGPEFTYTATWDPNTNQFLEVVNDQHDMFCAHNVVLEDGRIFVNGGRNDVPFTSTFDATNNTWTRIEDMNFGRWYPTTVFLPNGEVFTVSGQGGATTAERWKEGLGWSLLTGIDWSTVVISPGWETDWWPFLHLNSLGELIHVGPTRDMHKVHTHGVGTMESLGLRSSSDWYPKHAANVMYEQGKILLAGGATGHNNPASTNQALTIDITVDPPKVTPIAPMAHSRRFHNPVILANGEILVIGGNTSGAKFSDQGSIMTPEIWNPDTQTWREVADMSVPRNYHSIALLLKDGRVLSAGGGLCSCQADHADGQVYSPPYLFNPDGSLAQRPVILQSPDVVGHGETFRVSSSEDILAYTMVKVGSTTHAINTDQRFLPLPFNRVSSGEADVTIPSIHNEVVPGHYMLFAFNAQGVPSVAHDLQISTLGTPILNGHTPDQLHYEGNSISLTINAMDPENDPLTFSAQGLPPGLFINPYTGEIGGILLPNSIGNYFVTVVVSDGVREIADQFSWKILNEIGQINWDWWTGVNGGLVSDLTNHPLFPHQPSGRDLRPTFETPTNWGDQFGARLYGYLYPPVSGAYRFWISGDDKGELWLSTDANETNRTLIAQVPGWSGSREWDKYSEQQSVLINLQAGQPYFIEALHKEGSGGDHLAVAWQIPGQTRVVIDGAYLASSLSGPVSNHPPTLTKPGPQTHWEGAAITLVLQGSDPDQDPLTYTATNLPPGLTINATTGEISGTLAIGSEGTYTVSATVSDGEANFLVAWSWEVQQQVGNHPPTLLNPGAQATVAGTAATVMLIGSDFDQDPLTYQVTNLPPGLGIDAATGVITGTVAPGSTGIYSVIGSVSDGQASATVSFSWTIASAIPNSSLGQIKRDWWLGIPGNRVADLTNHSTFPNQPSGSDVITTFEAPSNWADEYGTRVSGYLYPPTTGAYTFWIAGDDNSELWLSTDANETNRTLIAQVPAWSGARDWDSYPEQQSVVINLQAGQPYFIEALHKEGAGGDHLAVAWQIPGQTRVVIDGAYLAVTLLGPVNQPPTLTNPGVQNNVEGTAVTLVLQGSDPDQDPLTYTATNLPPGLTINATTGEISGTLAIGSEGTYTVSATVSDGEANFLVAWSWEVQQQVGNHPPTLLNPGAQTTVAGTAATVVLIGSDSDQDPLTYQVTNLPPGLGIDATTGVITGTVAPGSTGIYSVIGSVSDGQASATVSFSWTIASAIPNSSLGQIKRDWWLGIPGNRVADLTNHSTFPNQPSGSDVITTFEAPSNWADEYGTRVSGYLYPPTTGAYAFWIAGDDNSELWLSTDANDTNRTLIAQVPAWSGARDWDSYPEQQSVVINLQAGQPYFIEALHKEGAGGDHLAVAWQIPGQTRVVIDGAYLAVTLLGPVNQPPTLTNPGVQNNVEGTAVTLVLQGSDPDQDPLTYTATNLPPGLTINATTGEISGTLAIGSEGTYTVSATVSDGEANTTVVFDWIINGSLGVQINPIVSPPQVIGNSISYTVDAIGVINPEYQWNFGDGTVGTPLSAIPTVDHTFTQPGRYTGTVTVYEAGVQVASRQFVQAVHQPLTGNFPRVSMSIWYEPRPGNDRVWNVNPDNDTVSVFDVVTHTQIAEIPVGEGPRSIALGPNDRMWVSNKRQGTISIIDTNLLSVVQTLPLWPGSQPHGIVFHPSGVHMYVVLEALGQLIRLDSLDGTQTGMVQVGPNPRHLSVTADGTEILVSRFITPPLPGEATAVPQSEVNGVQFGGEVVVVETAGLTITNTIVLRHSDRVDESDGGRGIPNYLGPAVLSPDGNSAWVPSKQDNIKRGTFRDGNNLDHDNTIRSISSRIDLLTKSEDYTSRIDHNDGGIPSTGLFGPYGNYLFVALEASREISVIDAFGDQELLRFDVGHAPQGLALSPEGTKLYVHNFLDRSISVHDISNVIREGGISVIPIATYNTVLNEKLSAQVLHGKRLFYDSRDSRLASQRYISCASCHNNGGQDGRVWDLTGFGEGLRNTISLIGRAGMGHGPLHWSANFDEVQDFEKQIRTLSGGTGLMSDADFNAGTRSDPLGDPKAGISPDLDALAAYVGSLTTYSQSPYRNGDGTLTTDGVAGRSVFENANCKGCHSGMGFTDSPQGNLHDVGTIKASSGNKAEGPLPGIDMPTLRGLWNTAPYLHDGSAATLAEAVSGHTPAIPASLLAQLVSYLKQIDQSEPAPPSNHPPGVNNPGDQTHEEGETVAVAVVGNDPDGDPLVYSASNLPPGLTLNPGTGDISGTVASGSAGSYSVVLTVTDPEGAQASTVVLWTVTSSPAPPVFYSLQVTLAGNGSGVVTGPGIQCAGDCTEPLVEGTLASLTATADIGSTFTGWSANCPGGVVTMVAATTCTATFTVSEVSGNVITAFRLYNAATDQYIKDLVPGSTVNLSAECSGSVSGCSIEAVVPSPEGATQSVRLNLDGGPIPPGPYRNENGAPYFLGGDSNGDIIELPLGAPYVGNGLTVGAHTVNGIPFTANNGGGTAGPLLSVSFVVELGGTNQAPTLTNPGPQFHVEGGTVSLLLLGSDPDNDPLTYSAVNLPPGLTLNETTGLISGTLIPGVVGNYNVQILVVDLDGAQGGTVFPWTVESSNLPPGVNNPGDQTHEEGETVAVAVVGNDPDGDPLVYSASNLPPGLTLNPGTGDISGTVASGSAGSYSVVLTVTDPEGAQASTVVLWTVTSSPAPPVFYSLQVTLAGNGSGVVTGPGIQCAGDCTEPLVEGTLASLTATADIGSTFTGWSANCPGGVVTMVAATTCTATFTVSEVSGNVITAFRLYNAATDQYIKDLVPGSTVNLSAECSGSVSGCSIEAVVPSPEGATQSVRLNLDGGPIPPGPYRNENGAPYFLGGDSNGDIIELPLGAPYVGNGLTVGAHTVNGIPFTANNGGGTAGPVGSVSFTVLP